MIFLFLIILSTEAHAMSLGTVVKNDFAKISISESTKFTVLFWNIENESYQIKLDVKEAPKDWIIIIDPNNFDLNYSVGKEYIKLPYTNDNIKATPVDIIVKPSISVKPGIYNITITAKTESPTNEIGFSQERLFKLLVKIENPTYFEESRKQNLNQNNENQDLPLIDSLKQINIDTNYFYAIIIIIIILISFLIYKYS